VNTVVTRVRDSAEGRALCDALRAAHGHSRYFFDDGSVEVRTDLTGPANVDLVRQFAAGFLHCWRSSAKRGR